MAKGIENHLEWLCNWALQKIYAAPSYQETLEIKDVFDREINYVDVCDLNPSLQILIGSVEDKLYEIIGYYEQNL